MKARCGLGRRLTRAGRCPLLDQSAHVCLLPIPFPPTVALTPPPPRHTAEMQLPKVSDESCDDDSSCSLSPGPSINAEYPPGLLSLPSLPQVLAGSSGAPPAMVGHIVSVGGFDIRTLIFKSV